MIAILIMISVFKNGDIRSDYIAYENMDACTTTIEEIYQNYGDSNLDNYSFNCTLVTEEELHLLSII